MVIAYNTKINICAVPVSKEDTETGTNSHIRRLTDEERVKEIANMLSGATLTEAALNNAKALISG